MTATALALAALLVLSTAVGADGHVVCTDDDGAPGAGERSCGCCFVAGSNDEGEPFRQEPVSPSCSDCIDVPMDAPSIEPRIPVLCASHTATEAAVATPETTLGCRAGSGVDETQTDHRWRSLLPLSTVVLLT